MSTTKSPAPETAILYVDRDVTGIEEQFEMAIYSELKEAAKRMSRRFGDCAHSCGIENFAERDDRKVGFLFREASTAEKELREILELLERWKGGGDQIEVSPYALSAVSYALVEILAHQVQINSQNEEYETAQRLADFLPKWISVSDYAGAREKFAMKDRKEAVA